MSEKDFELNKEISSLGCRFSASNERTVIRGYEGNEIK